MFNKVMGYIEVGKESGARCIAGGKRQGNVGFFIEPTVFADVKDDMKIAREEVSSLKTFHSKDRYDTSITLIIWNESPLIKKGILFIKKKKTSWKSANSVWGT